MNITFANFFFFFFFFFWLDKDHSTGQSNQQKMNIRDERVNSTLGFFGYKYIVLLNGNCAPNQQLFARSTTPPEIRLVFRKLYLLSFL